MGVCHMLIGHPCSGKTTFRHAALEILLCNKIEVLSLDDQLELRAFVHKTTYNEAFKTYSRFCELIVTNNAKDAYRDGRDVMWDMTNLTAKSRAKKLRLFPGYDKIAYVFPRLDVEEIMTRQSSRVGKTVPKKVIEGMLASYEPPTSGEGFDQIVYMEAIEAIIDSHKKRNSAGDC